MSINISAYMPEHPTQAGTGSRGGAHDMLLLCTSSTHVKNM